MTPADENICLKEIEKLSKYKDMEVKITRIWSLETESLPIIVGALGLIKNIQINT